MVPIYVYKLSELKLCEFHFIPHSIRTVRIRAYIQSSRDHLLYYFTSSVEVYKPCHSSATRLTQVKMCVRMIFKPAGSKRSAHVVYKEVLKVLKCRLSYVYSRMGKPEKMAFLSVMIFGFITHVHIFSINYIFHDSVSLDGLGHTYASGRWALGLLNDIAQHIVGVYQLPFINGFISLLLIALTAVLIINSLEVNNTIISVIIGSTLVAFPSVASHFAFMFTAPAYFFSMFLGAVSVFILHKKPCVCSFVIGALLCCFSVGIYQAYLSFSASYALVIMLVFAFRHDASFLELLKKGLLFIAMLVAGLILYLLINKAFLHIMGIELTTYQGLDKIGKIDFRLLPKAIFQAYYDQLSGLWLGIISCRFEKNLTFANQILCLVLFCMLILKQSLSGRSVLMAVLFLLTPLALNSVYIMSPGSMSGVHSLMRMSLVFTYVLPAVYLDIHGKNKINSKMKSIAFSVAMFILALVPFTYSYRDNIAYLNAELVEEQAEAYYGSMVTRIRSTEGYRDELPVAYIGSAISDSTMTRLPMRGDIWTYILSFSLEDVVSTDLWQEFCAIHLGWSPTVVEDVSTLRQNEDVSRMPCYPDDGSIKIIDGTVVVKLS